jgi:cell division protein FtsZ
MNIKKTIMMEFQPDLTLDKIIKVIGVGGGGSNAVNHMFKMGIEGVDFFICNTDNQSLRHSAVPNRIQLGMTLTSGLGAGSDPETGEKAALESGEQIKSILSDGTRMVFVTAGMGGGTGTGAAPVIAKIAKELNILTVGIVTLPFSDEGPRRMKQAEEGIAKLKPHVDALLSISNDRIVEMYGDLSFLEAFSEADNILCTAAKGIADIISKSGHINVDFNDVRTAMKNSGQALMGTGVANGESRAIKAAEAALRSPLLDNTSIHGAQHLLINVGFGNKAPSMAETRSITSFLQDEAGNEANLKMGLTHDEKLEDNISVTVIATGFDAQKKTQHILEANLPFEHKVKVGAPNEIEIEFADDSDETFEIEDTFKPEKKSASAIEDLFKTPIASEDRLAQPNESNSMRQLNKTSEYSDYNGNRIEKQSIKDYDMNIPAYKRRNIQLEVAPASNVDQVSRLTITESDSSNSHEFKIGPNRLLHDNVD